MSRLVAALVFALALGIGGQRAAAIDPRTYEPALASGGLLGLDTSYVARPFHPHLSLSTTLADDEAESLPTRWITTLAAGVTVLPPLALSLGLSLHDGDLGDLRAHIKTSLVRGDVGLAVVLGGGFPTGAEKRHASDGALVLDPGIVLDWRAASTSVVVLNVGYRLRPAGDVDGQRVGDALRFGLGASFQAARTIAVLGELEAHYLLGDVDPGERLPVEMRLGVRLTIGALELTMGTGTAMNPGVGAPDLRFLAAIAWAQSPPRPRPAARPPPPEPTFRPFEPDFGDDPDLDADGIARDADLCPDAPETPNGFADGDGCPDVVPPPPPPSGAALATLDDSGLMRLPSPIEFRSGSDVLLPAADPVIVEIARLLTTRLDITRVRIEGHTDDEGDEEQNVDLAERRAASVKRALVARGVAPERLLPKGFGTTRPIATGDDDRARAKNRRVELRVIARPSDSEAP